MPKSTTSYSFARGKHRFDIKRERSRGLAAYVGYVDGLKSITAPNPEVATRTLIKKHIEKLPEADVIDFGKARERLSCE